MNVRGVISVGIAVLAATGASVAIAAASRGPQQVKDQPSHAGSRPAGVIPLSLQVLGGAVSSHGTLERQLGTTAAVRDSVGHYRVTFQQNVVTCSVTSTVRLVGTSDADNSGEAQVGTSSVVPAQVSVTTRDAQGKFADRGFYLIAAC